MERKGDKKRGGEKIKAAVGRGKTDVERKRETERETDIGRRR